jgi:uncharacterized protein
MDLIPLTLSDYGKLVSFYENQRFELCEYTPTSVLAWLDEDYQPLGYFDQDILVICSEFAVHEECRHLLLPLSPTREFTPSELQDLALNLGRDAFWFVPDDYLQQHGWQEVAAFFDITEQPDHSNYIYKTEDLAQLKGNRYAKKRNLIHQFERGYVDRGRVEIESVNPSIAAACKAFIEKWCDAYPCEIESDLELICEKQAVLCAIDHRNALGLDSIVIRVDGEVSALAIGTRLTPAMGVLHFEKAFTHIKGLYQYLDRECARRLFRAYPYINKESDMGMPGLTKSKRSYHPVRMVKSYKLTVR